MSGLQEQKFGPVRRDPHRAGRGSWLRLGAFVLVPALAAAACAGPNRVAPRAASVARLPAGPSPRVGQSVVWTGARMLVWGGQLARGAAYRADGQSFDPVSGRWSTIPRAPLGPRSGHVAAWTGSRLIVWGGDVEGQAVRTESFDDGAAYDPATGRWAHLSRSPLEARTLTASVWTGSRLLIWGGERIGGDTHDSEGDEEEGATLFDDGAAYDPATDRWTPMAKSPLAARAGAVAVWTGRMMLVWGGGSTEENGVAFRDGAAYDPATNSWRPIGAAPVWPGAQYTATWTGRVMVVWGGSRGQGAAYDVATGRWTALPRAPLSFIPTPTAVWTGRVMMVWGTPASAYNTSRPTAKGAAFDPATRSWTTLPKVPGGPGEGQSAVWTGRSMIVWGGFVTGAPFASGAAVSVAAPSS
jgi:hypothetical protein